MTPSYCFLPFTEAACSKVIDDFLIAKVNWCVIGISSWFPSFFQWFSHLVEVHPSDHFLSSSSAYTYTFSWVLFLALLSQSTCPLSLLLWLNYYLYDDNFIAFSLVQTSDMQLHLSVSGTFPPTCREWRQAMSPLKLLLSWGPWTA